MTMKLKATPKKAGAKLNKLSLPKESPQQKKQDNKKSFDEGYKPMFPPIRRLVRETPSTRGNGVVKQYLEISVKRYDDDEAAPYLWLQMYQEAEVYTGYLKGKSVYLPLEMLGDLLEMIEEVDEECESRHIECW